MRRWGGGLIRAGWYWPIHLSGPHNDSCPSSLTELARGPPLHTFHGVHDPHRQRPQFTWQVGKQCPTPLQASPPRPYSQPILCSPQGSLIFLLEMEKNGGSEVERFGNPPLPLQIRHQKKSLETWGVGGRWLVPPLSTLLLPFLPWFLFSQLNSASSRPRTDKVALVAAVGYYFLRKPTTFCSLFYVTCLNGRTHAESHGSCPCPSPWGRGVSSSDSTMLLWCLIPS